MHTNYAFTSCFSVVADDCFQLGVIAYNRQDFYHAVMWLSQALEADGNEMVKTAERAKILDYLAYAMYQVISTTVAFVNRNHKLQISKAPNQSFTQGLDVIAASSCQGSQVKIQVRLPGRPDGGVRGIAKAGFVKQDQQ